MSAYISVYNSNKLDHIALSGRGAALLIHDTEDPIGFEELLRTKGAFSKSSALSTAHPLAPFLFMDDWKFLGCWDACKKNVGSWVRHLSGSVGGFPDLLEAELALASVNQFTGQGVANEPFFTGGLDQIATVKSFYFEMASDHFCKDKDDRAKFKDIYIRNFLEEKMMISEKDRTINPDI